MAKYAVIDLGTNTFHLLIVERAASGFTEIFREQVFVKLAEEGIETIGVAPFQRGLETIRQFKLLLDQHGVQDVRAFGTAALRTANNGQEFIEQVQQQTGIAVTLISGTMEAALIHKGVMQAVPLSEEKALIMDIGGGSVEFIIADAQQVFWAGSFPIGVAVLYNRFHHNDPITEGEIATLKAFLKETVQPLANALTHYPANILIGASGTFDVLENFLAQPKTNRLHSFVAARDFPPFYEKMLVSTLKERFQLPGIPAARAEMLIVALVLIDVIMELAHTERIVVSAYAMKEGMLHEMLAEEEEQSA